MWLALTIGVKTYAQTSKLFVNGLVCAEDGTPLVGALVMAVQNTKVIAQTTTKPNGSFAFPNLQNTEALTLTARFLGYQEQNTVLKNNQHYVRMVLKENTEQLGNVVITGFVNKSKEGYSGSSFVIDKAQLTQQVNTNLLDLIARNTPGFELTDNLKQGSNPNVVPEMLLRGRSGFVEGNNTNLPLFILDGVEVDIGVVFNLRTNAIEKVSILKDAAATIFYGAKAANGVIVITSSPTREGKLQIDYANQFQFSYANLSSYHLLNAADKLEYEKQAGLYGSFSGKDKTDIERQKSYYDKSNRVNSGINTHWLEMPLQLGFTQRHNITLTGGNSTFRYSVLGGISRTQGVMKKSERNSEDLRVSVSYGDWSKLFIQYTGRMEHTFSTDVPYNSFSHYASLNPYDAPYDNNGNLINELSFGQANPLYEQQLNSYIHHKNLYVSNHVKLRKVFARNWRIEANVSHNYRVDNDNTFYSPLSVRFLRLPKLKRGSFDLLNGTFSDLSANAFLVWNKQLGSNGSHYVSVVLGTNIQATHAQSNGFSTQGVLSDKANDVAQSIAFAEGATPIGSQEKAHLLGAYVNASYSFKNTYFVDMSYRREGSSKFGANHRYAPFATIGIAWNLHNEPFMRRLPFSLLKLRASSGVVGKVGFSAYQAQLSYKYNPRLVYNEDIGAMPVAMVNPNLRWERTTKNNLGLDFSLFNERLSGSIDLYRNLTTDLVMTVATQPHTGFSEAKQNLGSIINKGVELSLRGTLVKSSVFSLNGYLTFSHNVNRILKINQSLNNHNAQNATKESRLPVPIYAEGESLTALKVMASAGVNPANGKELFVKKDGSLTYLYHYNDRIVVGDTSPKAQGSVGLSVNYGSFSLSSNFVYRLGATQYNHTLATKVEGADPTNNVDERAFFARWKQAGDIVKFRNVAWNGTVVPSSRFVAKEYTLEGTSVMLSYAVSESLCNKLKVNNIKVSVSSGQFFYLSSVKRERGLDYPFARLYELGIQVKL